MRTARYTGPTGKHQVAFYAQAKAAPRKLHPYPEGTAERLAVRRMAEKGLVVIQADRRWTLTR